MTDYDMQWQLCVKCNDRKEKEADKGAARGVETTRAEGALQHE
jgi:hypothetical protein